MERFIIYLMEHFSTFLAIAQALILCSGSLVLLPNLPGLTTDPEQHGDKGLVYCEHGIVVFSAVFLAMSWFFILVGLASFISIRCTKAGDPWRNLNRIGN